MNRKKEISLLIKNVVDGDYAKARTHVSNVIECKINDRITNLNKDSKNIKKA